MSPSTVTLLLRAALLLVSFVGLCALVRTQLKVNRFIAPYAVACGVIVLLMIGGMLRVLAPVFWLIYAAGFAGFIYTYFIRRERPEYGLIAALVIFAAFLVWRFYFCPLYRNDDISHWGLVARHLLRYDAFPDKNATHVFFQSYPLGSAAFIYYIGRAVINTEGIYLVAQNLLMGLLFLPLLSLVHPKKGRVWYPIALAVFVFLFNFSRDMIDLRVDLLLPFFGLGITAAAVHYRRNLKKAAACAIPGMIAVVYVKNSGLFFAAFAAVLLVCIAHRSGHSRKAVLITALLSTGCFAAAYLLWALHISLSFPAALDTKHAISLASYAAEAASKSTAVLKQITLGFIFQMLVFSRTKLLVLAFFAGCGFLLFCGCMRAPMRKKEMLRILRVLAAIIGTYCCWSAMLYLMYIFSMPELEAIYMAGFNRYNGTGLCFLMCLTAVMLFTFFSRDNMPLPWPVHLLRWGCVGLLAVLTVQYCMPGSGTLFQADSSHEYTDLRAGLIQAREQQDLQDGGCYAFFCQNSTLDLGPYYEYYHVKYEFETADIIMLAENPAEPGVFLAGTRESNAIRTDLSGFFAKTMDRCNALLVIDESPAFQAQLDAFLKTYRGNTPVIYTYEY